MSFDRAATFYDRTRSLPVGAMDQVVEQLLGELDGRGPVLEIGVGTGRIALPLHEAGVAITGIDLSIPMMSVLVGKTSLRPPFPLLQADATRLPFRDAAFGAAIASHVFHLVPAWELALDEVTRVLEPGGLVLLSSGPTGESMGPEREIRAFLRRVAGATDASDHTARRRAVEEALSDRAAAARRLPAVAVRREISPAAVIDSMAAREWSWLWRVPDATLEQAVVETRAWAAARFGSLDRPLPEDSEVRWQAFELR